MEFNPSLIPKKEGDDIAYGLTKALLSAIPGAGDIFALLVAPPIQRRWEQWMKSVAEELLHLRERIDGIEIQELARNEEFITILLSATQIVVRNHDRDKISALRNAVLNCAIGAGLDSDRQAIFLGYIDELTPLHLRVLKYFDAPQSWQAQQGISFSEEDFNFTSFVFKSLPELEGPEGLGEKIIEDLISKRLISVEINQPSRVYEDPEDKRMMDQAERSSKTTLLGKKFLKFIMSP